MRVAVLDRDAAAASALAAELRGAGVEAISCSVDVSEPSSLVAAAAEVEKAYGSCHVLCAHVGFSGEGRFEEAGIDLWRKCYEIMALGAVATVQAFLPLMRASHGLRRIVLTSSASALAPGRFLGPYRAAKAAVTSIGETLDFELGPEGIGATVVFPSGMADGSLLKSGGPPPDSPAAKRASDPILRIIGQELNQDPSDLCPGEDAAEPVVEAVLHGRRYVITHGATVARLCTERQQLIDQALSELAERQYGARRPGP
jgi:NAD(P)-dependent dehydrogenase (short-subunit alcohol dehydrogenase family)